MFTGAHCEDHRHFPSRNPLVRAPLLACYYIVHLSNIGQWLRASDTMAWIYEKRPETLTHQVRCPIVFSHVPKLTMD